ncbi:MAG TPA: tetratricopeptide repeat protein [Anaeromyxobacteraceae bacterium]|nr:tetratricopeptide repeat protein [Anaeromyxobacteraceae bacterium]
MTPEERLALLQLKARERPGDPFVRYGLAMGYRSLGRDEEAVAVFDELMRRRPDYVPTYLMLGQLLVSLGRAPAAARVLAAGMEMAAKMGDAHAHAELSRALEECGAQDG